jgi:hypothetical protein
MNTRNKKFAKWKFEAKNIFKFLQYFVLFHPVLGRQETGEYTACNMTLSTP